MVTNFKKAAAAVSCAMLILTGVFLLFLPFPKEEKARDGYLVFWEDGTQTTERYADFAAYVSGIGDGFILIRSDKSGKTAAGTALGEVVALFSSGELSQLLDYRGDLPRLEKLAFFREFSDTLFYSGDTFAWDGEKLARTNRKSFSRAVLLDGSLPTGLLARTQVKELILRSGTQFSATVLTGSKVSSVKAQPPYRVQDGLLFLDSVSGTRLVAVLPTVKTVAARFDYLDGDALAACADVE